MTKHDEGQATRGGDTRGAGCQRVSGGHARGQHAPIVDVGQRAERAAEEPASDFDERKHAAGALT